jgi:hypothetical protein
MRAASTMALLLLLCAAAAAAAQEDANAAGGGAHSNPAEPTAAAAAADAADAMPTPPPASAPLDLLALGTVLHAVAPDGAPGRGLEKDALIYLRCYPTNTSSAAATAAGAFPAAAFPQVGGGAGGVSGGMPLAAAANADRRQGLHATLPVERVASPPGPSSSNSPSIEAMSSSPATHNAYHVGDWGALRGADLWCELYDIDRAAAGLTEALGGTLLRAADFAAAGRDQITCVPMRVRAAARARGCVRSVARVSCVC